MFIENSFEGVLFNYTTHEYQAFRTLKDSEIVIIYITGLGGKLLCDSISVFLYEYCKTNGHMFVQPLFRSHPHFGLFTLTDDHEELINLVSLFSNKNILLIGSSTGCQNIIYLAQEYQQLAAILVGPVSDREYETSFNIINVTTELQDIFMHGNVPMKKERYCDLFHRNGKDDLFSSDLGESHFKALNPNMWNLHFVMCENDEFVITDNSRLLENIPNSTIFKIKNADHSLSQVAYIKDFKEILEEVLIKSFKYITFVISIYSNNA